MQCPAEIYIERVSPVHSGIGTCYRWIWEIVQPDSHYGVWADGVEDTLVAAECKAKYALARVWKRQGY